MFGLKGGEEAYGFDALLWSDGAFRALFLSLFIVYLNGFTLANWKDVRFPTPRPLLIVPVPSFPDS